MMSNAATYGKIEQEFMQLRTACTNDFEKSIDTPEGMEFFNAFREVIYKMGKDPTDVMAFQIARFAYLGLYAAMDELARRNTERELSNL